jgi:glycosyltransferase involved in cell wall biosynthesis
MKYSVLIPAHNEEAFIGDCLQSIKYAADRVPDGVEIIVALNRCTDQTVDIAARHHAVLVKEDSKNLARIRNPAFQSKAGIFSTATYTAIPYFEVAV